MSAVNDRYSPFRTPVFDITGQFGHCQQSKRCRELELNVMDCTDVYGHKGLMKQCLTEYEDLMECMFHKKQLARVDAMKKERMRQYLAGERSKKDFYAKSPLLDGYYETYQRTID